MQPWRRPSFRNTQLYDLGPGLRRGNGELDDDQANRRPGMAQPLEHDCNLNITVQTGFNADLRKGSQQRRTGLLPIWRRFEKEASP
jgi:hypothetical protein